jgi:mannose-6-phosphate isomerase-like protein (cupin superfamily)
MNHVENSDTQEHVWEDITIREFLTPGVEWQASLVEVEIPPAVTHPLARSSKCETFYYCQAGELEFEVDNRTATVHAGDLVAIAPLEWYRYRNTSNETVRLLSFNTPAYDPAATQIAPSSPPWRS